MAKGKKVVDATPAPEAKPKQANGTGRMARHTWSGALSFGVVSVPVLLYTAAREERLELHTYHTKCLSRIKQLGNFCPVCSGAPDANSLRPDATIGEVRLTDDVTMKGYEYTESEIVPITKEEKDSMKPESAKTMEILTFVPLGEIDPIYFESSFYLSPDTKGGGQRGFGLIRDAMLKRGVAAIAKIVKTERENIIVIRPYGENGMMAYTTYMTNEIKPIEFPALPPSKPEELAVACQLVDALTGEWEPSQYKDTYLENMMKLIEAKRGKTEIPKVPSRPAAPTVDIMSAFAASIDMAKAAKSKARKSA